MQLSYLTCTSSHPFIRAGRLRALGVTTTKRSPALPELPAIAETLAGYDAAVWYGVLLPVGTNADVVARLNREFLAALHNTGLRRRLVQEAFEPIGTPPEGLAEYMKREIPRRVALIQETGARIDECRTKKCL